MASANRLVRTSVCSSVLPGVVQFPGKARQVCGLFPELGIATDVHRRFCLELSKTFPDYSDDLWGITASDSEKGYVIWGGPPAMGPIDGTVVPAAAGGSLPFQPAATMRVLKNIRSRYPQAWSRYGSWMRSIR